MNQNYPHSMRTSDERSAVTRALQGMDDYWRAANPDYETLSRERSFRQLTQVRDAVRDNSNADPVRIEAAYDASVNFANIAFDNMDSPFSNIMGRPVDRAFVVPLRANRVDEEYSSDTRPFYPLLDPEFGVTPVIQQLGVLGIVPSVIETNFRSSEPGESGVVIFAPLFDTMIKDIWRNKNDFQQLGDLRNIALGITQKTAELAHVKIGAKIIGLGATLPKVTRMGRDLKENPNYDMSELVTTTGHGGTVFLILETIKALKETKMINQNQDVKLGVIGAAGSIGWSTIVSVLDLIGDHEIYANDHRGNDLKTLIRTEKLDRQVHAMASGISVLENSNIIISAATRPVNLDIIDPDKSLNLDGKVIIDDSQPGCFDRRQVEQRGGKLVWVVGEDGSDTEFLTRDGLWSGGPDMPYNFGDEAGLYGPRSIWGCEAETGAIARERAYSEAITANVTPCNVRSIGRICLDSGVRIAPYQSYGRPVHIF